MGGFNQDYTALFGDEPYYGSYYERVLDSAKAVPAKLLSTSLVRDALEFLPLPQSDFCSDTMCFPFSSETSDAVFAPVSAIASSVDQNISAMCDAALPPVTSALSSVASNVTVPIIDALSEPQLPLFSTITCVGEVSPVKIVDNLSPAMPAWYSGAWASMAAHHYVLSLAIAGSVVIVVVAACWHYDYQSSKKAQANNTPRNFNELMAKPNFDTPRQEKLEQYAKKKKDILGCAPLVFFMSFVNFMQKGSKGASGVMAMQIFAPELTALKKQAASGAMNNVALNASLKKVLPVLLACIAALLLQYLLAEYSFIYSVISYVWYFQLIIDPSATIGASVNMECAMFVTAWKHIVSGCMPSFPNPFSNPVVANATVTNATIATAQAIATSPTEVIFSMLKSPFGLAALMIKVAPYISKLPIIKNYATEEKKQELTALKLETAQWLDSTMTQCFTLSLTFPSYLHEKFLALHEEKTRDFYAYQHLDAGLDELALEESEAKKIKQVAHYVERTTHPATLAKLSAIPAVACMVFCSSLPVAAFSFCGMLVMGGVLNHRYDVYGKVKKAHQAAQSVLAMNTKALSKAYVDQVKQRYSVDNNPVFDAMVVNAQEDAADKVKGAGGDAKAIQEAREKAIAQLKERLSTPDGLLDVLEKNVTPERIASFLLDTNVPKGDMRIDQCVWDVLWVEMKKCFTDNKDEQIKRIRAVAARHGMMDVYRQKITDDNDIVLRRKAEETEEYLCAPLSVPDMTLWGKSQERVGDTSASGAIRTSVGNKFNRDALSVAWGRSVDKIVEEAHRRPSKYNYY